jgi:hypothetical protein
MNLDFLDNDRFYALDVVASPVTEYEDLIEFKCRRCMNRFWAKYSVVRGLDYDWARFRKLQVRCPGC